jgi:hypothetical protein
MKLSPELENAVENCQFSIAYILIKLFLLKRLQTYCLLQTIQPALNSLWCATTLIHGINGVMAAGSNFVDNELLTYVKFHRNAAKCVNLRKWC